MILVILEYKEADKIIVEEYLKSSLILIILQVEFSKVSYNTTSVVEDC